MHWSKQTPSSNNTRELYTWTSPDGQHQNHIDYILCSQRWRSSIQSANTRPRADCGSNHELLIAKFRLKLKKVGKTTRPFRYGLPWWLKWSSVCLQCGRPGFNPWVRKIPWRRKWQPTPVLLPGKSHGQRSPWGGKESDTTEQLHFLSYGLA